MKVVITGATGNVGTALLRRLAEEPDIEVHGISRRPPADGPPYQGLEWTPIDIGQAGAEEVLDVAFEKADAVIHLAWLIQPSHDHRELYRTNVADPPASSAPRRPRKCRTSSTCPRSARIRPAAKTIASTSRGWSGV